MDTDEKLGQIIEVLEEIKHLLYIMEQRGNENRLNENQVDSLIEIFNKVESEK